DPASFHILQKPARTVSGVQAVRGTVEQIVRQCVEVGLVQGENLSVDGSFVEANAAKESRIPRQQLAEAAQVNHTVRQYLVDNASCVIVGVQATAAWPRKTCSRASHSGRDENPRRWPPMPRTGVGSFCNGCWIVASLRTCVPGTVREEGTVRSTVRRVVPICRQGTPIAVRLRVDSTMSGGMS